MSFDRLKKQKQAKGKPQADEESTLSGSNVGNDYVRKLPEDIREKVYLKSEEISEKREAVKQNILSDNTIQDKIRRATDHLDSLPLNNTIKAAYDIYNGFDIPKKAAFKILREYADNFTQVNWPDEILLKNLDDAEANLKKNILPGWLYKRYFNKFEKLQELIYQVVNGRYNTVKNCYEVRWVDEESFFQITDRVKAEIYIRVYDFALRSGVTSASSWASQDNFKIVFRRSFPDYDPIDDVISKLPRWDGHDYIKDLSKLIPVATESERKFLYTFLKFWMVGAVSQAMGGERNEMILVLAGSQGTYKTSFFRWLSPLPAYTFSGDVDPQNKDHKIRMCENVMIIMDELDSVVKKSDIDSIKRMLSETHVYERRPYAEYPERRPRRASFCGALNDSSFLQDHTGNRRWFIIELTKNIDPSYIEFNKIQLWAQAKHLFVGKMDFRLSQRQMELITERNKKFSRVTTEKDLILRLYRLGGKNEAGFQKLTCTQIKKYIQYDGEASIQHTGLKLYLITNTMKELGYKSIRSGGTVLYEVVEIKAAILDKKFKHGGENKDNNQQNLPLVINKDIKNKEIF